MTHDQSVVCSSEEAASLELALEQSREVKAKVEECADDIAHKNLLVKATIASGATTLSAHEALEASTDVESKVQECADDLHEVTETLAKGVDDQRQTEAELAEARQALTESQAELALAKEGEKEARLTALHDSNTGLPNRDLFDARLEQAISTAKRRGWTLAVMFFDLDRFKCINDTHGHAAGDAVLQEVAKRLSQQAREEDTVCRNGGDEFLYLLVNPQGRQNIERIAISVSERIGQPLTFSNALLEVNASIGIAVYPDDADSGEQLIRRADAAMYSAKRRRVGYAFTDESNAANAL